MKMRKLLGLSLAIIMSASVLTACGKDSDSKADATTTAPSTTTAAPTTEAPVVDKVEAEELVDTDPYADATDKVDLKDEFFTDKEITYDMNTGVNEGTWILGSDAAQMETPITVEDLDKYEAIQIFYTSDFANDTNIHLIYKVITDDTDPAAIQKIEFLAKDWIQWVGENGKDASEIYKQPLATTGILTVKTADIKAALPEGGKYINQIGVGIESLMDTDTATAFAEATGFEAYNIVIKGAYLVPKQ